jgi:hypothetical protein
MSRFEHSPCSFLTPRELMCYPPTPMATSLNGVLAGRLQESHLAGLLWAGRPSSFGMASHVPPRSGSLFRSSSRNTTGDVK